MRAMAIALLGAIAIAPLSSAAPAPAPAWLPINKSDLLRMLFEDSGAGTPEIQDAAAYLAKPLDADASEDQRARRAEMTAEMQRLTAQGDSVLFGGTKQPVPLWVTFAGQGEHVHSIRVTVPVVNYRSQEASDKVFSALSALFARIYPDWPRAKDWPKQSASGAWSNDPMVRREPLTDPNEMIPRKTINGITSATFGVPPDIIVYTITARDACVPDLRRGDPFRHMIC